MLIPRRFIYVALPLVLSVIALQPAYCQDADADQAKALLKQGLAHYEAKAYRDAKASLLKASDLSASLSEQDKARLDQCLADADVGVRKQAAANDTLRQAEESLAKNQLDKAEQLFAEAVRSEYLPAAEIDDAKARLALVREKQKLAAALLGNQSPAPVAEEPEAPVVVPVQAPVETPAEVPAETPAEVPAETPAQTPVEVPVVEPPVLVVPDQAPEEAPPELPIVPEIDTPDDVQVVQPPVLVVETPDAGADAIERLEQRRALQRQQAMIEFDTAMRRSDEALAPRELSAADFDAAAEAARVARNVLENNRGLFGTTEYRAMQTRVEDQLRWIATRRQQWERAEAERAAVELYAAEAERVRREEEIRRRRIATHRESALALTADGKFQSAIDEVQQILNIDPRNEWAIERREVLEQMVLLQQQKDIDLTQSHEEQRVLIDVRESAIPWYELLRYPRDWREISQMREGRGSSTIAESEANRQVRQQLMQTIARLDFDGFEFNDVVTFMRDITGLNIYVNWNALQAVGIDRSAPVNVHLSNVTQEKALRVILQDVGGAIAPLGYSIDEGVITISTRDELSRNPITHVYPIHDLLVSIPNFSGPELSVGISNGGSNTSGSGNGSFWGNNGANGNNQESPDLVNQLTELITSTIDQNSWRPLGDVGSISFLNGQLVVTQTAENHDSILRLINKLREASTIQIAIEARFISVASTFVNDIGIDIDFFFNIGSSLRSGTGPGTGSAGSTAPSVPLYTAAGALTPPGWAGAPGNNRFTPVPVLQNSSDFTNILGTFGVGSPALQTGFTFLDDIQVDFLLRATQAHSATRVLTAPRVTFMNGQQAAIAVTTSRFFISSSESDVQVISGPGGASTVTTRDIETSEVTFGTSFTVQGTVSPDLRYVTLTLTPQIATLDDLIEFPTGDGGFIQQPILSQQSVQTTVSVPDRGTLLLGGLKMSLESEREMGVPLLSKVPVLNRAFTNRSKGRSESTLLMLVKPTIIIQREEEMKRFPE